MGKRFVIRSRKSKTSLQLCTEIVPKAVCDRIRLARLTAGKLQKEMADELGIDRITYLRYEMGQVAEHNMRVSLLVKIAQTCGKPPDYCLNSCLTFLYEGAGKKIREYRKEHKLTQQQLAVQLGVTKTTVGCWEAEKDRPSPKYIEKLFGIKSTSESSH